MFESLHTTVEEILFRLLVAGLIGGLIGYERRAHHKAIGVTAIMLISDRFPDPVRELKQESGSRDGAEARYQKTKDRS